MKPKRISIRFNLENEVDRKAWEYLQSAKSSKNSTVISAINTFFEPNTTHVIDVIRQTIKECFQNVAITKTVAEEKLNTISEDESNLLDTLDEFFGD